MNVKLTYESIVTFVKDGFGLLAMIVMGVTALGFSFSPPWATAGEIEEIKKEQAEFRRDLRNTTCLTLRVLLNDAQHDLERAEDELGESPASAAAQRAKRLAEAQIADIEEQIRESKCVTIR